ncbi:unnamed protein product [Discosporangium mesarthrocarpum]
MPPTKSTAGSRALHWVLKIGNLRTSMNFFEKVLGLKVLRHEEFETGCEATCNGRYAGAWSKTMIGFGPEKENFALELTYNYGIDSYKFGNDLQYICLQLDVESTKAKAVAEGCFSFDDLPSTGGGGVLIHGPDNYNYKVVPLIAGREERFLSVGIHVEDLPRSIAYWCDLLGMSQFPSEPPVAPGSEGAVPNPAEARTRVAVGFAPEQVKLDLLQLGEGAVEHALSSGRVAFACGPVAPIHEAVSQAGGTVLTPPLTLPTPGKADVEVTILADPDGYEICFVGASAFYELATPTYDVIDFAARAPRGGDGAPPPKASALEHSAAIGAASTPEDVAKALEEVGPKGLVMLDFGAGWCKNCKRLLPTVESIATTNAGKVMVLAVDVDEAEDLADEHGVTGVPHFVVLQGGGEGDKVGEYRGSVEAELEAVVASALELME